MENQPANKRILFNKDSAQTAETLDIVLDNITQGLVVVSSDYTVLAFNKQVEELFQLPQGTVEVGRDIRDILKVWTEVTGQSRDMLDRTIHELDLATHFEIE